MLDIRKGQYFTNANNDKFIFLGFKNPHIIYCLEDNFHETNQIILYDVDFVHSILNEFNEKVKKINWYYQCKEEFDNTNIKDKLDTLISNISTDFKTWEQEVSYRKLDIRIKKINDLVKAKVFCDELNQYYEVIGFIVETETYEGNKKIEENKGLFSIYHSKCDNLAPMTFFYEDKTEKSKYYNKGTKDYCIVDEILINQNEIEKFIKNNNYIVPTLSKQEEIGMGL